MDRFNFRFWYFNKVEEKWKPWYCDLMSVDGTCLPFDNGEGGAYTDWEHEFICEQCTGLKDKNSKLIYEGDIIRDDAGLIAPVCFDEINAMFYIDKYIGAYNYPFAYFYHYDNEKELEVIGNIHENADLLEK